MIEHSEAISLLEEFTRRQEHVINKYVPSNIDGHNQQSYHESDARIRLLFGGNQSGKSCAAAFDCAANARGRNNFNPSANIKGRNVEIWVIAPEYSLIQHGIYRHLKDMVPDWDLINEGAKIPNTRIPGYLEIRRADGFKTNIQFLSSKGDTREKFQAAAVDFFYIDEEIPEVIWEELLARTLKTGGKFSISATLVESYDWIIKLEQQAERKDKNVFLTRLNTELNPYLDAETVKYLKSTFSKEALEYRFYGKARIIRGLIYNRFNDQKHVIKPFKIPLDWPRYFAMDPGIRTCAALWIAVSPDNKAYAYRELYAHNEPLWEVAVEIKKLEGYKLNAELSGSFGHDVFEETDCSEEMVCRVIDPKSKARSEAGEESIINQLFTRHGIICTPADNSVRAGIEDCRWWLENGFYVFDTLFNFREEIKTYRARTKKPRKDQNEPIEDPIRQKNHLMDCWRYTAREKPKWSDRILMPKVRKELSTAERIKKKVYPEGYHDTIGEW